MPLLLLLVIIITVENTIVVWGKNILARHLFEVKMVPSNKALGSLHFPNMPAQQISP